MFTNLSDKQKIFFLGSLVLVFGLGLAVGHVLDRSPIEKCADILARRGGEYFRGNYDGAYLYCFKKGDGSRWDGDRLL